MSQFTQCSVNFCGIFVAVQKTAQTSFRIFLQARIMVDVAKFNSHASGSHFKKSTLKIAAERKIQISL